MGAADDGFVFVEAGVQDHRHLGDAVEGADELVVEGIGLWVDGLESAGPIGMGDGGNFRALFFADLIDLHHEGDVIVLFKPVGHLFAQYRWGEGAEGFAALNFLIQDVLHVCAAWIAEDAAIPKRARSPLEPALEPADDFALADGLGGGLAEGCGVVGEVLDVAAFGLNAGRFGFEQGLVICITVLRAPVSVGHVESFTVFGLPLTSGEVLVSDQGCTDRTTCVSCGGLDVDILEGGVAADFTVGH